MSSVTSETSVAPYDAPPPPAPDMVWIPPGESVIGSDSHYAEERPAHRVHVGGFWIDRFPVTNARFAEFVAATGHVTLAELPPDPADYPGAAPEMLQAASLVFRKPARPVPLQDVRNWWELVFGADWRHPQGPDSTLDGLADHPVTHVAYADVIAFAAWAAKQLPTEVEWERAARGGLPNAVYAWGNEFLPNGRFLANTWQGRFPYENLREDGYEHTSPVQAFPPNGYGVYDMIGNVWEWTSDWYGAGHGTRREACCGAAADASRDPASSPIPRKVLKGGSHLCAPNYCRRYRPAARYPQPIDTSTCHVGFRCVIRPREDAEPASRS